MTEAEWLVCTDPKAMLEFLRDKASDRKLRLFACACCRRIWHLLTDERSRKAVEVGEQFADRLTNSNNAAHSSYPGVEEMRVAERAAAIVGYQENNPARAAHYCTVCEDTDAYDFANVPAWAAGEVMIAVVDAIACPCNTYQEAIAVRSAEITSQATLFRCIFGPLPFRPAPVSSSMLVLGYSEVVALAQTIYDDRTFDSLSELANALEEAGCTDADILAHCRGPGPHVRGCWVVDLLLGKG